LPARSDDAGVADERREQVQVVAALAQSVDHDGHPGDVEVLGRPQLADRLEKDVAVGTMAARRAERQARDADEIWIAEQFPGLRGHRIGRPRSGARPLRLGDHPTRGRIDDRPARQPQRLLDLDEAQLDGFAAAQRAPEGPALREDLRGRSARRLLDGAAPDAVARAEHILGPLHPVISAGIIQDRVACRLHWRREYRPLRPHTAENHEGPRHPCRGPSRSRGELVSSARRVSR
jgi:hypothetical protein